MNRVMLVESYLFSIIVVVDRQEIHESEIWDIPC
jgi:hypothetical protein